MVSLGWGIGAAALIFVFGVFSDHVGSAQSEPLTFESGTIVNDTATLTFSETLDSQSVPSNSAFRVLVGSSSNARRVSNVKIVGASVVFTLNIFVQRGDAATVEYCASGSNCGGAIRSQDGARTFTSYGGLTPITTPGPPPRVSGVSVEAYTITIDFDRALDSSVTPDGSAFTVTGFTTTVRKVVVSGMKAVLHVLPPMPPWTHSYDPGLTYAPPATDSLRTPSPAAVVAGFTRSSLNVNHNKLVIASTAVDGATLDLTFRVDLDEDREPTVDKFKVCPAESSADSACSDATDIEIDGKVVTLTFPSSALPSGSTVWLRYSGRRVREDSGSRREVGRIAAHPIQIPSTAAPVFVSGTADGSTVTLTFDSALDSSSTPPAGSFSVNSNAPSAVSVSGTQVTLTLTTAVAEGDAVSVGYTATGMPKLQGANGTAVAAFTNSVTNNTDTAPAPSTASITGATLTITFDQALDTSSTPTASTFSASVGGETATVSAVSLSGSAATLTLASEAEADDAVTVSYTQPATGGLRDATGNRTASFSSLALTNRSAPAPSAATVDGTTLTITFNVDLDTNSTPLAAAFSVAGHTVSAPTMQTRSVSLTLAPAVKEGATAAVAYDAAAAGSNLLRGANEANVASFTALQVTNQTDTAPVLASGEVNGASVSLTFDQNLDTSSVPPVVDQGRSTLSAFRVRVNEIRVGFSSIQVSGAKVTLSLLAAVAPSDTVDVQYQLQTNSPLRDTSTPANQVASFDPFSLTNLTPVQASSATVTGWTVAVAFTASLDDDPLPNKSAFTVTGGGDTLTVSSVSASGSTLTLRLTQAVSRTASVRVAYMVPMTDPLQDSNARSIPAFSLDATNNTPAAPTVSSATANGAAVHVSFNRSLSSESTTAVAAFTINGSAVTSAEVSNGKLALTAASAVAEGSSVTVAYTPSSTAKLLDGHGLAVAAFSVSATNNTDTAPVASSATATERSVAVVFDQNLKTTSTPPKTAFSLGSGGPAVTGVSISGKTVTLAVACCILPGAALQLAYTADSVKPLQDPTGNSASNFTISVTNRSRQGPSLSSASVVGDELRATFSATLDTMSKPPASTFTVKAGTQTVGVSSVALSGSNVVLDLDSSVPGDQTVTLSYALPTSNPLSRTNGAVVAPFSEQAVTNNSPPLLTSATADGSTLTLEFDTSLNTTVKPDAGDFSLTGATASAVAVSGSAVTITLSAAVAEGATVRLAYTPSAEATKGIEGTNGVRSPVISGRDVDNVTDTTPVVAAASVNLTQVQVTFDQALDTGNVPATSAFAIGPTAIGVGSAQISGSVLTLTLAQAVVEGASHTLAYTPPASNPLQDGTTNQVAQFTVDLDNQTDTAPVPTASAVNGATLTLTFDQALDATTEPMLARFTITGTTATNVAISGKIVTITLSAVVADGATIEAAYSAPASGGLQDPTGNAIASFTTEPTNGTDNAPSATGATVTSDGVTLRITFSEALSEAAADAPPTSQFSLTGTTSSISAVAVSGTTVTLTLSASVAEGATIGVSYAATGTKLLRDADQGALAVAAFSMTAENQVDYAPTASSAAVTGATLSITFDQALDTGSVPLKTSFAVTVAGSTATVTTVAVSGKQVALTLGAAATAAQTVVVSYTAPATGGIRDPSNLAASSFGPLTATNSTPPALESATADGQAIVLTFNAALDTAFSPPSSAFTVNFATVSSVSVSGSAVTLRLAAAVHETASLTVFYAQPSVASNRLKGANGAFVAAFNGATVENQTDTAPVVAAASVNLNRASITFDQDLDTTATPGAALFTLDGSTRTVSAVSVRNGALTGLGEATLTLSGNVREGASITIRYQPTMTDSGFQDPEGNSMAAFSVAAENTTDTAPIATAGSVDGTAVVVTFDQPLDLTRVPPAAKFSLSGTTASVSTVQLRNDETAKTGSLELTLGAAVAEGATVALTYDAPTAGEIASQPALKYLRDQQGNAASLSAFALTNLTDTAPVVASASVDGASLTVVFDQALDATSPPAAVSLSVSGGRTIDSVAISRAELRLTLGAAVADGDTMELSYSVGSGARIRDLTGNDAAAFTEDVENLTDTAPVVVSAVTNADGSELKLTMSESVKKGSGSGELKAAFTFEGSDAQVDAVALDGAAVTLSLAPPIHELDEVTLEYARSSGEERLLDADQGELAVANFQVSVTNDTDTAPEFESASVDVDIVTVVFDQPLAGTEGPPYLNEIGQPLDAFEVRVGGAKRPFHDTTISGRSVLIRLLQGVATTDSVTVKYQLTTTKQLQDTSSQPNDVTSFDEMIVDNVTAAAPSAATVNGASLRIVFDGALGTATPDKAAFVVRVGGVDATVSSVGVSGTTVSLALAAAVAEGAAVTVSYSPPDAMPLVDANERAVRAFSTVVQNDTDTAPVLLRASVVRGTLTLTFDQPLTGSAAGAFRVTENAASVSITDVDVAAAVVTLTLSSDVAEGSTVRVAYDAPSNGGLSDATGNPVASFDAQAANATREGPQVVSVEARLTELVVTFDEPLDPGSPPAVRDFSITRAPDVVEVIEIDGAVLRLRLAAPGAGPDSRIRLTYRPRSSGGLRDAQRNLAPDFTVPVADRGSAPSVTDVIAIGQAVVINFDGPLSAKHVPPFSWWHVFAPDRIPVVAASADPGGTVTLIVKAPGLPDRGQDVTVVYLPKDQGSRSLRGASGHRVQQFHVLTQNDTRLRPQVVQATVNRAELTLQFSEPVTAGAAEVDWFKVSADRHDVGVARLMWEEHRVILILERALTTREAVTLSYVARSDDGVRDSDGLRLESFAIEVANRTSLAETLEGRVAAAETRARARGTASFEAVLQRELARELAYRGGVYAVVDASRRRWDRAAHESGAPAFMLERLDVPGNVDEARLEVRRVGYRALLGAVLGGPTALVWEADDERPHVLAAWRIDLSDENGVPLNGSAVLTVDLPQPAVDAPLAVVVFDLVSGAWRRVEHEMIDGAVRLRVKAPAVAALAALPLQEVKLWGGVTPVWFDGAAPLTPSAFAAAVDESVIGVGVQEEPSRYWDFVAVADPEAHRPLRRGERVLIVRDQEAPPIVVELPVALIRGPAWEGPP